MAERGVVPVRTLWTAQLSYHVRRTVRTPRAIGTGMLMPVVLLILADSDGRPAGVRVAGLATLGVGMTAWTTHGIGLVAAREAGELLRWRAMPVPRWCPLAARIVASVLAAALAGAATVTVGGIGYHVHVDVAGGVGAACVLLLGAGAWAAPATAMTRLVTGVETAWPVLGLTYLPVIATSGALGSTGSPSWLRAVSAALPARPLMQALSAALGDGRVTPIDIIVLLAWTIGGLGLAAAMFRWAPTAPREVKLSPSSRAAPASGTDGAASTSSSTRSAGSARG